MSKLFVAVFPPPAVREDLRRVLPADGRFTRPSKWHVTLAFLGEVDDARLPSVTDALATVPAPAAFSLRLTGGGRFGPVAWAGLAGDLRKLGALRESVRVALDDAGFTIDPRPFRPHLTVSYHQDRGLLTALAGYAGPTWPVTDFALVESALGNYHVRQEWALPPNPSPDQHHT
ncbi:RNA 2',3'-cyclic phosphodiesterase [Actinoplanes oblitus]|uniref:RNA 2',3'-cyclic phosphodiesterase n=1 Tax=Actinoplanes oblitus TaxID=3040509 RepID=A0ABY8WH98_9ACTN|nr:RNA 2',3'-cyclic phosphodiesterase [Actinoplanes oblitus]WIM96862.1 RNA 2',3'-cyclic phosphodiesterase [Actinoplanes oblitus]